MNARAAASGRELGMTSTMRFAGALLLSLTVGASTYAGGGTDRAARDTTSPVEPATATARASGIVRASDYIGKSVRNLQNETLGEVIDLAIDGRRGRVVYAVMAAGGFLGLGQSLYAVPLGALRKPAGDNALVLDLSPAALARQTGFDAEHWPEHANIKAFSQGVRDAPADAEAHEDAVSPGKPAAPR